MNLFNRKPTKELPPLISDEELDAVTYNEVLEFLTSINNSDYAKIIKVVNTYRKANCEVAKITGLAATEQRSIFDQPTAVAKIDYPSDTELGDFLEDKPKGKKVTRKNAKA